MDEILRELLDALERIGKEHGEIYDTEVRERMFDAVYTGFIEPHADYAAPARYGLYDASANEAVREALASYVARAAAKAEELGLETPRERLAAFQNPDVQTSDEQQYTDDFFGWMNPADLK
jgi:hypothetical protein